MTARKDVVAGSFGATGVSEAFVTAGGFNVSLSGFGTATVQVQRSFDDGSTWKVVESFTADAEKRADDPSGNVWWRFECTAYTTGTILYRMSS